ncbi:MAG: nucleoside triphosphate pyrophosphohydrolase [Clostridiales bacterium]|nr:nucleoside triphosphate pyrophosphohydrolase [Clostridiales bacterium]
MKNEYSFKELLEIMKLLRKECPWDREQTHESLKIYMIEETYEVLETIDRKDMRRFCDELGDLLLQVVFHAEIAEENNAFNMDNVISGICRKLISRHTHIFGDVQADTSGEVLKNWEEIKKKEKGIENQTDVLKDIPSNLPALMRSYKVQQKAAQVGFDWEKPEDVFEKIDEEMKELHEAYGSRDMDRITDELGDVLFSVVNLSRFLKVQPELALTGTTEKFIRRFEYVEAQSARMGLSLKDMTLAEMDVLWNEAKAAEKKLEQMIEETGWA